jgi:hypothetical protein
MVENRSIPEVFANPDDGERWIYHQISDGQADHGPSFPLTLLSILLLTP